MSLTKELEEQLKAQRDKLLDLSGTNRLVDFKFKIKENARSQNYLRIVEKDFSSISRISFFPGEHRIYGDHTLMTYFPSYTLRRLVPYLMNIGLSDEDAMKACREIAGDAC